MREQFQRWHLGWGPSHKNTVERLTDPVIKLTDSLVREEIWAVYNTLYARMWSELGKFHYEKAD